MSAIEPGLTNQTTRRVEERHLASQWGSGLAAVLATPALVAFCEECARLAVEPLLPPGQQTVGTWISLRHLAATPPGATVRARAEVIAVEGRQITLRVQALDEQEQIGTGTHTRYVIDVARFMERAQAKA